MIPIEVLIEVFSFSETTISAYPNATGVITPSSSIVTIFWFKILNVYPFNATFCSISQALTTNLTVSLISTATLLFSKFNFSFMPMANSHYFKAQTQKAKLLDSPFENVVFETPENFEGSPLGE